MNEKQVQKLYQRFYTPDHVIHHCLVVTRVADTIAGYYEDKKYELDSNSIHYACKLHDMVRIIDFNDNPQYDNIRAQLKKQYPSMSHGEAAAYVLGYEQREPIIASIVRKHAFDAIIKRKYQPFSLEEKIATYADKRVLHTDVVSLQERFEDGRKRYNPHNIETEKQQAIYDAYYALEKELFEPLKKTPEDIK